MSKLLKKNLQNKKRHETVMGISEINHSIDIKIKIKNQFKPKPHIK